MALLVCVGVDEEGFREVLAVEVAGSGGAAYASLLRALIDRGLSGVRLVISDDHEGIKAAVAGELPGTEWQRSAVHFQRNVLSHVPASSMSEVAEDLSAIFKVRREKTAEALVKEFVSLHEKSYPKAVSVFEAGIADALSYLSFPSHHARIRSTNMLERLFKEVKRRTRVVGVFPNETSALPRLEEHRSVLGFSSYAFTLQNTRSSQWRDPDSNRGHHDFQSYSKALRYAENPHS